MHTLQYNPLPPTSHLVDADVGVAGHELDLRARRMFLDSAGSFWGFKGRVTIRGLWGLGLRVCGPKGFRRGKRKFCFWGLRSLVLAASLDSTPYLWPKRPTFLRNYIYIYMLIYMYIYIYIYLIETIIRSPKMVGLFGYR